MAAVGADGDGGHPLAGDRDGHDLVDRDEPAAHQPLDAAGDGGPPLLRVLLDAAVGQQDQVVGLVGVVDDHALDRDQRHLGPAGAQVDGQHVRSGHHGLTLQAPSGLRRRASTLRPREPRPESPPDRSTRPSARRCWPRWPPTRRLREGGGRPTSTGSSAASTSTRPSSWPPPAARSASATWCSAGTRATSATTTPPTPAGRAATPTPGARSTCRPCGASPGRTTACSSWASSSTPTAGRSPCAPASCCSGCCDDAAELGYRVKAALEFEWFNFLETPASLRDKGYRDLTPLTPGMFGYSILRQTPEPAVLRRAARTSCGPSACRSRGCTPRPGPVCTRRPSSTPTRSRPPTGRCCSRSSTKEIASRFGILASFMARWNPYAAGLQRPSPPEPVAGDGDDARNLFFDADDPRRISDTAPLVRGRSARAAARDPACCWPRR